MASATQEKEKKRPDAQPETPVSEEETKRSGAEDDLDLTDLVDPELEKRAEELRKKYRQKGGE